MGKTKLRATILRLEAGGLISRIPVRIKGEHKGYRMRINLDDEIMAHLPTPKRLQKIAKPTEDEPENEGNLDDEGCIATRQGVCRQTTDGVSPDDRGVYRHATHIKGKDKRLKEKVKGNGSLHGAKPTPTSSIKKSELDTARDKADQIKADRKEKMSSLLTQRKLTKANIDKCWRNEVALRFPDTRPLSLSRGQQAAMWQKQKAYNEARPDGDKTFAQFICWCLDQWGTICRFNFGWMKTGPDSAIPESWFIIRNFPEFYRLYEKREGLQWIQSLEGFDAESELCKRLQTGQSYEEAKLAMKDRATAQNQGDRLRAIASELRELEGRLRQMNPEERRQQVLEARAKIKEANNQIEL